MIAALFLLQSGIAHSQKSDSIGILKVSDLEFNSIFGYKEKSDSKIFCVLGTGFFKTPRSDNSDTLLSSWLNDHSDAIVIPVSSMSPGMSNDTNSSLTYCLILDGADTLNNYLIRNGCYPGGTMIRPPTYDEISDEMKELLRDEKSNFKIDVLMDKESYEIYLDQIEAAEIYARENKLGIWSDEYMEKDVDWRNRNR